MSEDTAVVEEAAPEAAPETPTTPSAIEESSDFLDREATPAHEPGSELGFLEGLETKVEEASEGKPPGDPGETPTSGDTPEESPADKVSDFPDAEALGDVLDEKASAKWGELRSELSEARSRADELEARLGAEIENEFSDPNLARTLEDHLHQANETIEAYEQELSVARVETSPEYTRAVTEPLNNIMEAAAELAKRNELEPDAVVGVLMDHSIERQNQMLEGVTGEMGERDKMMLYRMVDDAQAIFDYDTELKNNAAEAAAEIDYNNQTYEHQALQQYTLDARASVNKVYDKFESVLPEMEGTDIGEMRNKTLTDNFLDLGIDHQAYALSAGTMLPPMVKTMRAQEAKIAGLEKQLASYQAATPGAAASGGAVQTPSPDADPNLGFLEALNKMTQ